MRKPGSLVVLVGLAVAPPLLLLRLGFYRWTSLNLWASTDLRLALGVLTIAGWIAWACFALSVVTEATRIASQGRIAIRLPGLALPRAFATALLSAVIATSSGVASNAAPPPGLPPAAAPQLPLAPSDREVELPGATPNIDAPRATVPDGGVPRLHHVVEQGDDLWSLAERYYGAGSEWRTLVRSNPALAADPTAELRVGTTLAVERPLEVYTVQHGDTLWHLAEQRLGDGKRYPELQHLNADLVDDPDYIETGWQLTLPAKVAAPAQPAPAPAQQKSSPPSVAANPPASPTPTPTPTPASSAAPSPAASMPVPAPGESVSPLANPAVRVALGGLAALAASGVVGGVIAARRDRDASRELGRSFAGPGPDLHRFETALGLASGRDGDGPPREELIGHAMRAILAGCRAGSTPVPQLRRALVEERRVVFEFDGDVPEAPWPFSTTSRGWAATWDALKSGDPLPGPVAYPGLATLGRTRDGVFVMVDVTGCGVLEIDSASPGLQLESVSAMLVELSCAPWANDLAIRVVTEDASFVRAAAVADVRCLSADEATAEIERVARDRLALLDLDGREYDDMRLDPDVADAWAPLVVLFESSPDEALIARITDALGHGRRAGVGAVLPLAEAPAAGDAPRLTLESGDDPADTKGVLLPEGLHLSAQTLPPQARASITGLYRNASVTESVPAPWWRDYATPASPASQAALTPAGGDAPEPAWTETMPPSDVAELEFPAEATDPAPPDALGEVVTLPTRRQPGPRLRLLGAVALDNTRGTAPTKAQRRCLEYCAWLLENPGATASEMTRALFVSDGTRRSNLSRLRAWLGQASDGSPYLPEAYTGRVTLHRAVTSDWAEFQGLVSSGVNRTPPARLRTALGLVAGAPLADAGVGEWAWADDLRSRIVGAVRDAAVVLARVELERGRPDAARWAIERGRLAAPDDELLACESMRCSAADDDLDAVRATMGELERWASKRGLELRPETVALSQELLEGRPRAVLPTGSEG